MGCGVGVCMFEGGRGGVRLMCAGMLQDPLYSCISIYTP